MGSQNKTLTLDRLNEDCLEQIFVRLRDVPEQLQVARVCQLFQDVLKGIWQRNPLFETLSLEEWRNMFSHIEDFKYFLHAMANSFTNIRIIDECLNAYLLDLEELGITVLPGVKRCFVLQEYLDSYPKSDDIKALTKLLPNLQYFRITATISGQHLADFEMLEELHLYSNEETAFEIKDEFLHEICEKLKNLRVLDIRASETSNLRFDNVCHCRKLEELKLNLNTLQPALNDILSLPKLRKLNVLLDYTIDTDLIENVDTYDYKIYQTNEFFHILDEKAEKIIGIAVDNFFMPLSYNWDTNLQFLQHRKLQTFAFCNCEFEEEMLQKYTEMSQLRLLCCRHWERLTNAMVLQFIKLCTGLEHLDVAYCRQIDGRLLYDALHILKQQKRQRPLYIYYVRSGLETEVETDNAIFWLSQTLIKFSDAFPPNSDRGLSYINRGYEFEFEC